MNKIYFGDNLEVMNSDLFLNDNKNIEIIYIDPPYNTMSSKSYNDTFKEWGSFMQPRLIKARELLGESGVVFISIDDNEYANLKVLCDEIFGSNNFLGTFITKQSQRSNAKFINTIHEYVLVYAKEKKKIKPFSIKRVNIPEDKKIIDNLTNKIKAVFNREGKDVAEKELKKSIKTICYENNITWIRNYCNVDENGEIFYSVDLSVPGKPRTVDIPEIGLHLEPLSTRGWSTDEKFIELYNQGRLAFKGKRPYSKIYLEESEENCSSILDFYSRQGTNELKRLGIDGLFDTPKPIELIKYLIRITGKEEGRVLDFFAGSGTTAQAVAEINEEDNKNLEFTLIQIEENFNKNSEPYLVCNKIGIKPIVSEALLYRLNKSKEVKNLKFDFEIHSLT